MARPTKLTPEVRDKIVKAISAGAYATVAAKAAGIGESTYFRWLEEATKENAKPELVEFRESVKEAEAQAEIANIALIRTAAQAGTWQAAAWYLERKHAERWGRTTKLQAELSGPNGNPIQIEDAKAAVMALLDERAED